MDPSCARLGLLPLEKALDEAGTPIPPVRRTIRGRRHVSLPLSGRFLAIGPSLRPTASVTAHAAGGSTMLATVMTMCFLT
jgi:hypothetical protein